MPLIRSKLKLLTLIKALFKKSSTARSSLLTDLPNELILLIAEELDTPDLNSFLQTNRHLTLLLTPLFHKHFRQKFSSLQESLHYAAQHGDPKMVELLLDGGAKIDASNRDGDTALHMAVESGKIEVVRILLKRGANVNLQNSEGCPPLDKAVRKVKTPIVQLLLENGASIFAQDWDRDMHQVLRWAVEFGTVELVELLLGSLNNVEIAMKDSHGRTALHFAVERTQHPVIVAQLLLERGVDINARDINQRTALYYALIELLREYCFEKRISAHRRRREDTVTLLIEKGAELDVQTINLLVRCEKKIGRFNKIRGTLCQALNNLNVS